MKNEEEDHAHERLDPTLLARSLPGPLPSEEGTTLKVFKDFQLKARAIIWP